MIPEPSIYTVKKNWNKKIDEEDENLFLGATFNLKQFKEEDIPKSILI